jgi:GxxExxY protein
MDADGTRMNADTTGLIDAELTEKVIGAFHTVYNELGYGFVESVYENAFAHILRIDGVQIELQAPLVVRYRDVVVGEFRADAVIERRLLVELKAVSQLSAAHEAQLVNYPKATGLRVGLLLNFGPRAQFRRRVLDPSKRSAMIRANLRTSAFKISALRKSPSDPQPET